MTTMIDEHDLRDRLERAAAEVAAPPDLLPIIERRITTLGRRTAALRVAGAVAVVALAAGVALVATGDDGDEAPVAVESTTTVSESPTTTTTPLAPGWAAMADAPIAPRTDHLVLAMDDEVLVWGGRTFVPLPNWPMDGAVYAPATDSWRAVPDAPLPGFADGVWTGSEAILVSGGPPQTSPDMAPGPPGAAAFDPATDTWRPLAAPPAGVGVMGTYLVWTGTHVVVISPSDLLEGGPATVSVYDPATDTWAGGASTDALSSFGTAVWTGTEVLVVASAETDPAEPANDEVLVRAYDPVTDSWRSLPWGLGDRSWPVVAWTGDRLFVGGGVTYDGDEQARAKQAALLDPTTGEWTPAADAPLAIFGPEESAAIWTGDRVLTVSAGDDAFPILVQGPVPALTYDPATDTWAEGPVRPDAGVARAGWVWAAGRAVVPLGGTPVPLSEDGAGPTCCTAGPAGGATYVP